MSINSVPRGTDEFRAAAGMARWSPSALAEAEAEAAVPPRGPGLFRATRASGEAFVTNVRRIAGAERASGSRLISAATVLLALLAIGLFLVSLSAQYKYVFAVKHEALPSYIEAIGLDVGMAIFSLLALGLAMAGQPARIERILIVACALGSAGQNYAAADVMSPRSVAAYIVPPVFLAVVVDRVVAVVRRHVLGDDERSAWAALGKALTVLATAALYGLRFILAPPSTAGGMRRWVLIQTPLPAAEKPLELVSGRKDDETKEPAELEGASKKARLTWWYKQDPAFGDRTAIGTAAKRLAPVIDLSEGTARAYIAQILTELEKAGAAS